MASPVVNLAQKRGENELYCNYNYYICNKILKSVWISLQRSIERKGDEKKLILCRILN